MTENKPLFVVTAYDVKQHKNVVLEFDSKASAESFKSSCKPINYLRPTIYPKALYDRLHNA